MILSGQNDIFPFYSLFPRHPLYKQASSSSSVQFLLYIFIIATPALDLCIAIVVCTLSRRLSLSLIRFTTFQGVEHVNYYLSTNDITWVVGTYGREKTVAKRTAEVKGIGISC